MTSYAQSIISALEKASRYFSIPRYWKNISGHFASEHTGQCISSLGKVPIEILPGKQLITGVWLYCFYEKISNGTPAFKCYFI